MYKEFVLKRIVSSLCVVFLILFAQGCVNKNPAPAASTQNRGEKQDNVNPKLSKLVGKNYVKGIVRTLTQDPAAQAWNYEVDGIDTTNGKLSYVNFNHKSVLANESDLVYVAFDGMRVTEMFVIKEGFKSSKRASTTPPVKKKSSGKNSDDGGAGKRDKAHQVVGVPQEETVKLN